MPKKNNVMLAQVRQQSIADLVNQKGNVTVNDLCEIFNVSPATTRNDLRALEERCEIKRTHGGAISCNKTVYELNTYQKEVRNVDKKRAIAQAALSYIQEGDAIALDSGTTTFELAKLLGRFKELTVLTNDLQIAGWLERNTEVNIIMVGGSVRRHFRCTVGQAALEMLATLHVDKAFVAVNGISVENGLSTPSMDMASIKKNMINAAEQVILLADSSKIGRTALAAYAPISILDIYVTDEEADSGFISKLQDSGIDVILAKIENE
jgi:DeoR family fructose operon transcriptional repressor